MFLKKNQNKLPFKNEACKLEKKQLEINELNY